MRGGGVVCENPNALHLLLSCKRIQIKCRTIDAGQP